MGNESKVSPLEAHLGFWLRYVSNHVSHAFGLELQKFGLSIAEWVVLREIYDADTAPSDLAARIGMTRGAVSKIVEKLVTKSLVRRTDSKTDRRYQILALSEQGLALVPTLARLADHNDEAFFSHLETVKRLEIIAVMKDIVRRRGLAAVPVD
jgi:DNA-binding MarR family transcriptional regulator